MRNVICLCIIAVLVGCSSVPREDSGSRTDGESGTRADRVVADEAVTSRLPVVDIRGDAQAGGQGTAPLPRHLSQRSIYFDYDTYTVKPEFRALVEAHAKYLRTTPNARVIVQGNTDDRGTREYNLALGHKRADAIKQLLQLLGAKELQVEAVSFGKEKPRNPGQDEAAWAENRRGDIAYAGE